MAAAAGGWISDSGRATLIERRRQAGAAGDHAGVADAERAYVAALPRVALARCPFTGDVACHSLDDGGIEGPWWDYLTPVRPAAEDGLPETVFAVTGALAVGERPPVTSHLVKGGPEAPFVVPRLLERPEMRAVVNQVRIGSGSGELAGFAVIYFAQPMVQQVVRFNTWGANVYWYRGPDGRWGWDNNYEDTETLDFDLSPWIAAGKLAWIEPGDSGLVLRSEFDRCPYLGLPGRRTFVRVQFGEAWEPTPDPRQAGDPGRQ